MLLFIRFPFNLHPAAEFAVAKKTTKGNKLLSADEAVDARSILTGERYRSDSVGRAQHTEGCFMCNVSFFQMKGEAPPLASERRKKHPSAQHTEK